MPDGKHKTEKTELVVSFWDVALSNFPEGAFIHRKISTDEAVQLVNHTKEKGKVFFGTHADIGAPYKESELHKTKDLVSLLRDQHGMDIHIRDFFSDIEEGVISALPSDLFDIRPERPLLVVTCGYTLDRKALIEDARADIAPQTVAYHLFEYTGS